MSAPDEGVPSLEQWRALYAQTARFKKITPWKWMWDSNLFGVKNPEDGETGYCCVLGAGKEVFGLAVYLGHEGLEGYWNGVNHPELAHEEGAGHIKRCLLLTFDDRGDLEGTDLEVIKNLGFEFKGVRAWPQFRSYRPGYCPWHLTAKETRFLTLVLDQANEIVLRFKANPSLFDSPKPHHYWVRVRQGGAEHGEWSDTWQKPVPITRVVQISKSFDSRRLETIAAMPQKQMAWEVDFFYTPAVVREKGRRPYFPMMLLFSDHESYFIFNGHFTEPGRYLVELHEQLLQAIEKAEILPEEILVKKEELQAYLKPLCERFGIGVSLVDDLPAIRDARGGMREFLAGGKGPKGRR
ncbi:MAG: hypothetical protein HYZ85_02025 [Candidatus Omnitrophica bacterium]|nr:hypothetical protein [Candidatus Omnitrophota bacterium]